MKKKRIIFSDIDGTIYSFPEKELLEETKNDIINAVENNNVEFVLSTGNPFLPKIEKLAKELKSRYLICSGGSTIHDLKENKILKTIAIDKKSISKILEVSKKYNEDAYIFSKKGSYKFGNNIEITNFLVDFFEIEKFDDLMKMDSDDEIIRVEFHPANQANKDKIYKELQKNNLKLNVVNLSRHLEITPEKTNKGIALIWLCDYLDVDKDCVMAIGDSENDISMLEIAGYSYAMDNSNTTVKQSVKYFTSDVKQNGLGEAINDYIFRTKFVILREDNKIKQEKRRKKEEKNEYFRNLAKKNVKNK